MAKVKTAAPENIVSKASIVMMQGGQSRELQRGSNGYTCLIAPDGTPLCADQNGMEWIKAVGAKANPPDKIGFIYMLAGDTGATNHHPHQREDAHALGADRASCHDCRAPGERHAGLFKNFGRR